MSKSKMKSVAVLVGICALFDLGLSCYHTHSMLGAIVGIVLGLGSTAFFVWLHYEDLP
jgi:hypothetical protein